MRIEQIKFDDIATLLPLYSLAYGAEVSLDDEQDFWNDVDTDAWFWLVDQQGNPIAYIRDIMIGKQEGIIDYYCLDNNEEAFVTLLRHWSRSIPNGKRLRVIIGDQHKTRISLFEAIGFDKEMRIFYGYTYLLNNITPSEKNGVFCALDDLKIVQRLLASEFQSFTEDKMRSLIQEKRLIANRNQDHKVVAVGLVNLYETQVEIVEMVVDKAERRKGYGMHLLESIIQYYGNNEGYENIVLKVKSTNQAAIHLYEKIGFVANEHLTEYWLYK